MLELMTVLSIGICLSVGVLLVAIWQVKFSKIKCAIFDQKYQSSYLVLYLGFVNISSSEYMICWQKLLWLSDFDGFLRKMLFCIPVWSCLICSLDGWKSYNQFHRLVGLATFSIFIYSKPNII